MRGRAGGGAVRFGGLRGVEPVHYELGGVLERLHQATDSLRFIDEAGNFRVAQIIN